VVGEAANATDARAQYRELRPDVVLADVALPSEGDTSAADPSALVAILCEDPGARVIVSGYIAQRSIVDAALANGACAYVAKPFHPVRVVETVRRVLAERPTESLANPEDVRERAENRRV
jgi:DNA-binding NarL/FixJ family response regulator